MDRFIEWSLRNRLVVLAGSILLLGFGSYEAVRMPVDVFPDLTAPTVTVLTECHGMAPEEVERQVTFPIEAVMNGASGVRRVRSSSSVGISVVWVEFEWGTDIHTARQIVSEKLSIVSSEIPPRAERPVMAPITSIMGEVMFVAIHSQAQELRGMEVRSYVDTVMRRRLLAVPGVAQVTPIGGFERQYQVVVSPAGLEFHQVGFSQLLDALQEGNESVTAGILNDRGTEYLVTTKGRMQTLEGIANTLITTRDGIPITVGDVAKVQFGPAPRRGVGSANAQPAVVIGIQKQPEANTLALTKRLDAALDELQSSMPDGMVLIRDLFRQADFIEVAVNNVQEALRDGAILVVIVILVFLGNGRATFITLLAIPLSLLTAVLFLDWVGATINTMTLGGMAIAIGALVDDAIIDVENVLRRLREGQGNGKASLFRVVLGASVEIRRSIAFATFIIVLVFVPLFFLSGVEGRLLQPLGFAYVVSLLASLIVAMTLTPVLCFYLLPTSPSVKQHREPRLAQWLKHHYGRMLPYFLRHPWRVALPALVLFIAALAGLAGAGGAFLPPFHEGSLTISATTLPGTSLDSSDQLGRMLEQKLLQFREVQSVARRTGRAEWDEHAMGVESSEIDVSLKMGDRSMESFLEAMRVELASVPGMNITIGQPISHRIDHMLSGTRANVAVKIFGPDLSRLRELGQRVRSVMENVEGVVDLSLDQQMEVPVMDVQLDRGAVLRHGLSIQEANHALEAAIQGMIAGKILEGRNAFDLAVRMQGPEDTHRDNLDRLPVLGSNHELIPLSTVAKVIRTSGPNRISREQVERKIVVSCNVSGRDVISVVEECREEVDPILVAQKGYRVEYGGQFESAISASRRITAMGALAILGIGLLLFMAFENGRDAILVMLNLPLALIGGVAGVYFSGGVLTVASLIGFITVFGIATRNGIMLVSHIRHLQEEEGVADFYQAVLRGAVERLVPILMTALATAFALVPLALGGGEPGNEIQTPMATVILSGLFTSMLLNMLIVPALYLRLGRPARGRGV